MLGVIDRKNAIWALPQKAIQRGRRWGDHVASIVRQSRNAVETRRLSVTGPTAPDQQSRRMEELTGNVGVQNPRRVDDEMFERHDQPHPVDGAEHDLKLVFRPLSSDDARTWRQVLALGNVSELDVAQVEVGLDLLQFRESLGALAFAAPRRTMEMVPEASYARPEHVGGPGHGRAPENRDTQTQSKQINDLA